MINRLVGNLSFYLRRPNGLFRIKTRISYPTRSAGFRPLCTNGSKIASKSDFNSQQKIGVASDSLAKLGHALLCSPKVSKFNSTFVLIFGGTALLTGSALYFCMDQWFSKYQKSCQIAYCTPKGIDGGVSSSITAQDLCIAVRRNDFPLLKVLVEDDDDSKKTNVNVNMKHSLGWTALHVACVNGNVPMAKYLLEHGADPNLGDEFTLGPVGNSASNASRQAQYQNAVSRVKEFSNVIRPDAVTSGCTALHYAVIVMPDNYELIEMLLQHGADPSIRNEAGHDVFDYLDEESVANASPGVREKMKNVVNLLQNAKSKKEAERVMREKELRKRFPLESRLKKYIIGQKDPISAVSAAIRRRENGWCDDEHPLVFLFLGSSGIGKTELAKRVAEYIHSPSAGQDDAALSRDGNAAGKEKGDGYRGFIRIDMSEFQSKHEVAKFIGSPPGYVGFEEGGQLTEKLKACPDAVVLLDEVEKAHPDVLTIMLQLFDEGRLTDGRGKTIECKDAIFIMTSNLAQDEIAKYGMELRREAEELETQRYSSAVGKENGKESSAGEQPPSVSKKFKENVVRPILKDHFQRDEFLGRITEILYFLPFSRQELYSLVVMELDKWADKALKRHDMVLKWTDEVVEVLTEGYNVHYGARSIKHDVERRVVNEIAAAHEKDLIAAGSIIQLYVEENLIKMKFTKRTKRSLSLALFKIK